MLLCPRAIKQNERVHKYLLWMLFAVAAFPALLGSAQPSKAEQQPAHLSLPPDERIDINHATIEQLIKATGIPRTWAERIVRFRPYRAKNELIDKGVLPITLYNQIKDAIIAHRDAQ